MKLHRNHRKHAHHVDPAAPSSGRPKPRTSLFDGLDAAARTFLGPADRTDGTSPVIHQHDAAEDSADETLGSIDIYTDSAGHHYAQRRVPLPRPVADGTTPSTTP